MKTILKTLLLSSFLILAFSCHKQDTTLYQGTFFEGGHGTGCPNAVTITKSIPDGLPVRTALAVIFSDTTQLQQLQTGEKIEFRILNYQPDTNTWLAICLMPQYDATIELIH